MELDFPKLDELLLLLWIATSTISSSPSSNPSLLTTLSTPLYTHFASLQHFESTSAPRTSQEEREGAEVEGGRRRRRRRNDAGGVQRRGSFGEQEVLAEST